MDEWGGNTVNEKWGGNAVGAVLERPGEGLAPFAE